MCPRAKATYDKATSEEAADAISAACTVLGLSQGRSDLHLNEKLELAQVRYRHTLRRLQQAYPGELCGYSQHSAKQMVEWTVRVEACAGQIPAARIAGPSVFDLSVSTSSVRK